MESSERKSSSPPIHCISQRVQYILFHKASNQRIPGAHPGVANLKVRHGSNGKPNPSWNMFGLGTGIEKVPARCTLRGMAHRRRWLSEALPWDTTPVSSTLVSTHSRCTTHTPRPQHTLATDETSEIGCSYTYIYIYIISYIDIWIDR